VRFAQSIWNKYIIGGSFTYLMSRINE
jgi:hypothetical protein